MAKIDIYTDGSSRGNPGPGGYGIVLISGKHRKEVSKGFRKTTNNRMELMSVIDALTMLKGDGHEVTVFSDSKYVIDAINEKWVWGWNKKAFKGKKNADLWKLFLKIFPVNKARFVWVKGHASNKENNRCDELAVEAAMSKDLHIDHEYENGINDFE